MHTRADYLAKRCTHREYYAQFVNERTKARVLRGIGRDRLQASTDPHFNDIPLRRWDALAPKCPGSAGFRDAGDYYTLAGGVCLLKEASRQILESEQQEQ